jgi:hypothetical protein
MRNTAGGIRMRVAMVVLLLLAWAAVPAWAKMIQYPVWAPDGVTQVGWITAQNDGHGVKGSFESIVGGPPPTLQAAAQMLGEHHFNWFQVVVEDNHPPRDAAGNPLSPPYTDPPRGGYGPPGTLDEQWADKLPWYWDEYAPLPPYPPNWDEGYLLESNLEPNKLLFEDTPGSPFTDTKIKFATWMVSLYADGSVHRYYEGFSWTWSNSPADPAGSATIHDDLIPHWKAWEYTIPEPATALLAGAGIALLARRRRRRAA